MNVILDACAVLALGGQGGRMSAAGMKALGDAEVAYFPVTAAWEIALKAARGRLKLRVPAVVWCREVMTRYDLQSLPFAVEEACAAADLPPIHLDPFDRLLVALARGRSLLILTSDHIIPRYPDIQTLW